MPVVTFEQLRTAYDEAFERFRDEVRQLGSYGIQEPGEIERRIARAEALYRRRRDALADFLLGKSAQAAA